jgi:uncharacterized protein (DUF433 family)
LLGDNYLKVNMQTRISIDPQIHFGKPCVAGSRIPVQNVLELVREGIFFPLIISDYYPDLVEDDIRACVQYAMDLLAVENIQLAPTSCDIFPTTASNR